MSSYNFSQFAKSFDSFINNTHVFEDSTLSMFNEVSKEKGKKKPRVPKDFINKVHSKMEQISDEYPLMSVVYKKGMPQGIEYKYFRPAHDIDLPKPIRLTGDTSSTFAGSGVARQGKEDHGGASAKTVKSPYTDLAWFLESLPIGPCRAFLVNPDIELYFFIYDKKKSLGAAGYQYKAMAWDPIAQRTQDFGSGELVTAEVDRSLLGKQHEDRGGNTNGKIGQYIGRLSRLVPTKEDRGRVKPLGAPNPMKPVYAYDFSIDPTGELEPRSKRMMRQSDWTETKRPKSKDDKLRTTIKGKVHSTEFLRLFIKDRMSNFDKISPKNQDIIINGISSAGTGSGNQPVPEEFEDFAKKIGRVTGSQVFAYFFKAFRDFREQAYLEGTLHQEGVVGAYEMTSGYDIVSAENKDLDKYGFKYASALKYRTKQKLYQPGEVKRDPVTGNREAMDDKAKRYLPEPVEYASIPNLVKKHSLMGLMNKFEAFLYLGKVFFPAEPPLATRMGIKREEPTVRIDPFSDANKDVDSDEHFGLF
ncbi:hypothetical protein UFOVP699_216 [uncultured Caudovirales phage]|uniref:Uncharacterized protein n=1 Tax=uncultured Caudovirales phage TaxID=2100421 RepID=A0A6J5NI65_9CAUD|nr:hypothetical protein UFOVP699_216 [uncultured Caudovirales phage]